MLNQPKQVIFSRIFNPGDYKIENTLDNIKIVIHAQNGELISIYVDPKVIALKFAADITAAAAAKNIDDLKLIERELKAVS
jgi:hypothetical protein